MADRLLEDRRVRGHAAQAVVLDEGLELALRDEAGGDQRVIDLYEGLAIADIQAAADVLRPVYDASKGSRSPSRRSPGSRSRRAGRRPRRGP
jgi:transaldolase/glucose-6-phosphate isomerase